MDSLNPCHTRVAALQRSHSVLKIADRRGALCSRLERHAAAFVLSMLKINAAACLHSVLDSAL